MKPIHGVWVALFMVGMAWGGVAFAQADLLRGTWIAPSVGCGTMILKVTHVEPGGMVRGTLDCRNRSGEMKLGDKAEPDKVMVAKLSGSKLTIVGVFSTMEFTVEPAILKGWARSSAGTNPVEFTKQ